MLTSLFCGCFDFYPRSPCGERRVNQRDKLHKSNFYPRSPCGERRLRFSVFDFLDLSFLSTLSLRRATVTVLGIQHKVGISIHALLAESDTIRL